MLFWRLLLQRRQGRNVNGKRLNQLRKQCALRDEVFGFSERQIVARLELAEARFKSACKNSHELCDNHLKGLAKALAEQRNTNKETELKKLCHISDQRKTAAKVQKA